jgi:hypothetical protein
LLAGYKDGPKEKELRDIPKRIPNQKYPKYVFSYEPIFASTAAPVTNGRLCGKNNS